MNIQRSLYSLLILCLSISSLSFGQQSTEEGLISGTVEDINGQHLELVNILLLQLPDSTFVKGTTTSQSGVYELGGISNGEYLVAASMVGYRKTYSDSFTIKSSGKKIVLEPIVFSETLELEGITVSAQRPLIERKADRTVINVENSIVDAGNNAWEILLKSPGVSVDNNEQLSISGKQGTVVMMNGKKTHLSDEDLAAFLRGLPSSSIEKVEIITNPSAKYDASGNAGIINIVNRKSQNTGFNANTSISTGAGWNGFYSPAVNFNYRAESFNLYGNYNFANRDTRDELGLKRRIVNNNQDVLFDQTSDIDYSSNNHIGGIGLDYFLTQNHTLGFYASGISRDDVDEGLSSSHILDRNNPNETLDVSQDISGDLSNYSINLNYQGKLGEGSLSGDINVISYDIGDRERYLVETMNQNQILMQSQQLRNVESSGIDIQTYKLDYLHPVGENLGLELGIKRSDVETRNDIRFDSLKSGSWVNDPTKTNRFNYDETVSAGYVSATQNIRKLQLQGGLRIEQTKSVGNSITLNEVSDRDYADLFPSFSVTYKFSDFKSLGFSYSRRVDRPNYQRLNPFIWFVDPFTFIQGNPFLIPQYTDNFELSANRNSLSLSLGFSNTKDAITFVTTQVDSTFTGVGSYANLENIYNYNAALSYQRQLTRRWSTFSFLNFFYSNYKSDYNGGTLDNSQFTLRANINNNIQLPNGFKAEVSGFYQSPIVFGLIDIDALYVVNAGLQKKLGNGLDIKLAFNDILDSSKRTGNIRFQNQDINFFVNNIESRFVLTLSYGFGNQNIKAAKRRRSGAADEEGRVVIDE